MEEKPESIEKPKKQKVEITEAQKENLRKAREKKKAYKELGLMPDKKAPKHKQGKAEIEFNKLRGIPPISPPKLIPRNDVVEQVEQKENKNNTFDSNLVKINTDLEEIKEYIRIKKEKDIAKKKAKESVAIDDEQIQREYARTLEYQKLFARNFIR